MLATKNNILKEIKNKVLQMSNSTTFQNTLNLLSKTSRTQMFQK